MRARTVAHARRRVSRLRQPSPLGMVAIAFVGLASFDRLIADNRTQALRARLARGRVLARARDGVDVGSHTARLCRRGRVLQRALRCRCGDRSFGCGSPAGPARRFRTRRIVAVALALRRRSLGDVAHDPGFESPPPGRAHARQPPSGRARVAIGGAERARHGDGARSDRRRRVALCSVWAASRLLATWCERSTSPRQGGARSERVRTSQRTRLCCAPSEVRS